MKLYINEEIIIVNNEPESTIFIYDRVNHIKSEINKDMFEILEYIYNNEGISIDQINEVYFEINDVINDLISMDILKISKQKRYHNVKHLIDIDSARLFVELTDKCNLRCKHCYGNFKIDNLNILSINVLKKLITQAIKMNVYQFDLTGGEPLLYKDLEKVLSMLYEAGMLVTIFTNLTMLTDEHIKILEKYRVKKIITSIDSHIDEAHDEFRGVKGALKRTVESIKKLQKNTSLELSVNTMVGMHNKDTIKETLYFLKDLNIPCVLDSIVPNGRAKDLKENNYAATQVIHDLYYNEDITVNLSITDCGVGRRFLYIKSNGNICLCPSLTESIFVFGNINNDYDLNDVWNNLIKKYGNLSCTKKCSKKKICNGGCRARAYHVNGSLYEKDYNSCILAGECSQNEIK